MEGEEKKLEKGKFFVSRMECTRYVQDVTLTQGKRAVLLKEKSGGSNFIYVCDSKRTCSFYVKCLKTKQKDLKGFFISDFNSDHIGCTGNPRPTSHQIVNCVDVRSAVLANRNISGNSLQTQLHNNAKVGISHHMSYRVREQILDEMTGDYHRMFQKYKEKKDKDKKKQSSSSDKKTKDIIKTKKKKKESKANKEAVVDNNDISTKSKPKSTKKGIAAKKNRIVDEVDQAAAQIVTGDDGDALEVLGDLFDFNNEDDINDFLSNDAIEVEKV